MQSIQTNNNYILSPSVKKTWNKLVSFKNSLKKSQIIDQDDQCKYASIRRTNKVKASTILKTKSVVKLSNYSSSIQTNVDHDFDDLIKIEKAQQLKLAMISTLEHELNSIERETMEKFSSKSSLISTDSGLCTDISLENFEKPYIISKSETLV